MDIKDIKQILKTNYRHGLDSKITTRDTVKLFKYINQLEADKLEMAKAIVNDYVVMASDRKVRCIHCRNLAESIWQKDIRHSDDCIVNKAEQYIKRGREVKETKICNTGDIKEIETDCIGVCEWKDKGYYYLPKCDYSGGWKYHKEVHSKIKNGDACIMCGKTISIRG